MNKWIYIFAAASLAMAGCSESEHLDDTPTSGKADHVTLTFDVEMPELWATTKTLGENPKIEDIHVAVFGATGYLEEYVLATAEGATENTIKYTYEVELPVYESDCSLDFIANGPDYLSPGYESQVIGELVTSGGQDAYWQRFKIAGGIKTTTDSDGNTVLTGDFIESNGLDDVKLIRNFSRLTVKGSDNFTVERFLLVNEPTMGSIAPYNSGADDIFVSDYLSYGADSYESLASKYKGFTPAKAGRHTFSESDSFTDVNEDVNEYAYFYEFSSKATEAGPMYLLVNGKYKENESSCYKILLVDTDGNALSFLRNFGYTVTLNVERQGESSAAAADMTAGTDDFSMVTEDIIEVSDGKGVLSLDYRVKAFTENSDNFETLGFVFKTSDDEYPSGVINVAKVDGDDDIISDLSVTTDNCKEGGVISYKVDGLGKRIKKQSFTVTADYNDRQLSLTVTVYLIPEQPMRLTLDPSAVHAEKGSAVTAWIDIPANLPDCLFPLSFAIEAEERTLSPDASSGYPSLPVETGTSTIEGNNSNSYWFVRTLTEEEYDALSNGETYEGSQGSTYSDESGSWVRFDSHFVTNMDDADSDVWASNTYFESASDELETFSYGKFTELSFSGDAVTDGKVADGEDNAVAFSFVTEEPGDAVSADYVIVTLVGLEPADGSPLEVCKDASGNVIYDNGNVTYKYVAGASAGSHSLDFTTISISDEVAIYLSGTYFDPASLSSERSSVLSWAHVGFTEKGGSYPDDISNGSVTPDKVSYSITDGNFYTGNYVGFTSDGAFDFLRKGISYYRLKMGERKVKYNFEFAYDSEGNLKSGDVTVVLSGGTILTEDSGNTGTFAVGSKDGSYTFTPSSSTTAAQTFYLTSSFADPVSVSISADGYSDDTETMDRAFYVEENALYISSSSTITSNYSFQVYFLVADYMATGDASKSISFLQGRYDDINVTSGETRYGYRVPDSGYETLPNSSLNANKEHAIDLNGKSGLYGDSKIYLQCYNGTGKYSGTFYETELTLRQIFKATSDNPCSFELSETKR